MTIAKLYLIAYNHLAQNNKNKTNLKHVSILKVKGSFSRGSVLNSNQPVSKWVDFITDDLWEYTFLLLNKNVMNL